jgi:hypothetical protein
MCIGDRDGQQLVSLQGSVMFDQYGECCWLVMMADRKGQGPMQVHMLTQW